MSTAADDVDAGDSADERVDVYVFWRTRAFGCRPIWKPASVTRNAGRLYIVWVCECVPHVIPFNRIHPSIRNNVFVGFVVLNESRRVDCGWLLCAVRPFGGCAEDIPQKN